ncbi:FadR/GntR family transcriptional regulator [Pectinatus haikarae]|uniref:GntR family transcriptional repressor for pyruvate dehydrogenase complex n=1 Tax=Pectinatus haikarae TaxID=349096 RepID=A0ABT9Y965_9FIRM|nr:FCD domain-containing protein [Pectinatus haikarae]MDQ0204385.1 GntR family transcriptional repressor for pyruvate dehydrogenase complex [Pectinatus haikarae]
MMENTDKITNLANIFEPRDTESSVTYVINNIKDSLLTKKLLPGEKLPSEMDLSRLLSVSRGSIREAMKILAAFGIIQIKRGDGTYISKDFSGKILFDPLLFSFILSEPAFEELQDLRLMLEEYIVGLVIKNQTSAVIDDLSACNIRFRELKKNYYKNKNTCDEVLYCDLEFHHLLAKFAKNRLIERIYNFVLDYFKPYIRQSIEEPVKQIIDSMNPHEQMLDAIKKKDVTAAKQAVHRSIEVWRNLIVKDQI